MSPEMPYFVDTVFIAALQSLILKPKEKRTLNVEYVVQYPKDYTQRSYRNASNMPQKGQRGSDFEMNSLQLQLRSLESKF